MKFRKVSDKTLSKFYCIDVIDVFLFIQQKNAFLLPFELKVKAFDCSGEIPWVYGTLKKSFNDRILQTFL